MRILLVEDEEPLIKYLTKILQTKGYTIDVCSNGRIALEVIELHHHVLDLIILDITLPELSGLDICKRIREENITIPVIMLTAKGTKKDIVQALEDGADDYLPKPFAVEELLARIKAVLRRPPQTYLNHIDIQDLSIWPEKRKVYRDDKEISLTAKEFELLYYLASNSDRVINRETLLEKVWDMNFDTFSNVVDVHIKNLRRKLHFASQQNIIESVRGVGFRIRK